MAGNKKRDEHMWEVNFFLGMINFRKNELNKAADYMEQAYTISDYDYYTLTNYARILYRKNEFETAREKLNLLPEDMQDYNEKYYNLHGLLAMAENNLKEAVNYFEQAHQLNLENYYVLNNLVLAQIRRENFQEAKTHLEKAVTQKPDEAYVYNNLGINYENLGQLEQAKEYYEKALGINPDHYKAERACYSKKHWRLINNLFKLC